VDYTPDFEDVRDDAGPQNHSDLEDVGGEAVLEYNIDLEDGIEYNQDLDGTTEYDPIIEFKILQLIPG
jgi:hypothetical protein